MSTYSEGLKHGYSDMARFVQDVLDLDLPDAAKLERIGQLVAPQASAAVAELPDTPDGN